MMNGTAMHFAERPSGCSQRNKAIKSKLTEKFGLPDRPPQSGLAV
jgi:hypothetical protein